VINHRNHSGNTPLHWAALNTHLECVKVLVEAGADVSVKNEAGLDPVFLAERADWSAQDEQAEGQEEKEGDEEVEIEIGAQSEGEGEGAAATGPLTKGREVVEWLLAMDKSDETEGPSSGANAASGSGAGEEAK
jgi:hypothetical protein